MGLYEGEVTPGMFVGYAEGNVHQYLILFDKLRSVWGSKECAPNPGYETIDLIKWDGRSGVTNEIILIKYSNGGYELFHGLQEMDTDGAIAYAILD